MASSKDKAKGISATTFFDPDVQDYAVNFDTNTATPKYYEENSSDEDEYESLTILKQPTTSYEGDKSGKIRVVKHSEAPRNLALNKEDEVDEDQNAIIPLGNPVNNSPAYQHSRERKAETSKEYTEENNPFNMHYDASREPRADGAGYYQFSADAERMAELLASRQETALKTRQDSAAKDLMPGQEEGMTAEDVEIRVPGKRKRRTDGRQQIVGAKRQKLQRLRGTYEALQSHSTGNTNALAELETLTVASVPWTAEPFAALETLSPRNTDIHADAECLFFTWASPESPQSLIEKTTDPFSFIDAQTSATVNSEAFAASTYSHSFSDSFCSPLSSHSPGEFFKLADPFSVPWAQASTTVNSKAWASASPVDPFSALDTRKPTSTVVRYKGKKPVPLTANKTD